MIQELGIVTLKQDQRAWYSRSGSDPILYAKVNEKGNMLIIYLYVDDLIFTSDFGIKEFRIVMESEFEMIDLGLMNCFLEIEVQQYESGIFKSQSKYTNSVLKRFNVSNFKASPTPITPGLKLRKDDDGSIVDPTLFKRIVGSLMYLTATRNDIMYRVSMISRFMESPKDSH